MAERSALMEGTVVASHGRHCMVETPDGGRRICHPRGKKNQAVVGDHVLWQAPPPGQGEEGTIPETGDYAVVLDAVFSLDAVIAALGLMDSLFLMLAAVAAAVPITLLLHRPLADFMLRHPTIQILCLNYLMLVGLTLVAEGLNLHIPKGYLYAVIGFSMLVEGIRQALDRRRDRRLGHRSLRLRTAGAVLRLLGGSTTFYKQTSGAAAQPLDAAGLPHGARDMLYGVLTMGERHIRAIMTPRPEITWVDVEDDPAEIRDIVRQSPHSVYPVRKSSTDEVLGVVYGKDIMAVLPEAGPAEEPGRRGVGLGERLEEAVQLVGGDADAGVRDGEAQAGRQVVARLGLDLDPDASRLGELDGVAQRIVGVVHLVRLRRPAEGAQLVQGVLRTGGRVGAADQPLGGQAVTARRGAGGHAHQADVVEDGGFGQRRTGRQGCALCVELRAALLHLLSARDQRFQFLGQRVLPRFSRSCLLHQLTKSDIKRVHLLRNGGKSFIGQRKIVRDSRL